jgi:hypothetical protein
MIPLMDAYFSTLGNELQRYHASASHRNVTLQASAFMLQEFQNQPVMRGCGEVAVEAPTATFPIRRLVSRQNAL